MPLSIGTEKNIFFPKKLSSMVNNFLFKITMIGEISLSCRHEEGSQKNIVYKFQVQYYLKASHEDKSRSYFKFE